MRRSHRIASCVALRSGLRTSIVVLGFVAMFASEVSGAASAELAPSTVKAAFLVRFGSFVRWPASSTGPLTIAVTGDDEMASALRQLVAGRAIVVRTIDAPNELGEARILYIGHAARSPVRRWASALDGRAVLIVSDDAETLADGQAINFVVIDHRVRFEVALEAADRAGLKLDAGLLNVAARVVGANAGSDVRCPERARCTRDRYAIDRRRLPPERAA